MTPLRLLLVNLYHEAGDVGEAKANLYRDQLIEAGNRIGLPLEISTTRSPEVSFDSFAGIVLSGSHLMVGDGQYHPKLAERVRRCQTPLLGICYGHQLLARSFGGLVARDKRRHDGPEELRRLVASPLFSDLPERFVMAESHEEVVVDCAPLREHFDLLAVNAEGGVEAIAHRKWPLYGVQFHPERSKEPGLLLLAGFLQLARRS